MAIGFGAIRKGLESLLKSTVEYLAGA